MKIRAAGEGDLESLLGHVLESHKIQGHGGVNPSKISDEVHRLLAEGLILVADVEGETVGSLALDERSYWYGDDRFLTDVWFFVLPEHRKGGTALKLLQEARVFARDVGARFYPAITPGHDLEKLTRFYRLAGFVPLGIWFQEAA